MVAVVVLVAAILAGCGADDGTRSAASDRPTYAGTVDASPTPTGPSATASGSRTDLVSGLPWVAVADLPPGARATLHLVDAGGPFPYPGKDGSTFGNFEGMLPKEPRGYYAEYTVPTPGSRDRGARRIITGDGGELYWTADHYQHFERIRR
jgi:ribonuclease T1